MPHVSTRVFRPTDGRLSLQNQTCTGMAAGTIDGAIAPAVVALFHSRLDAAQEWTIDCKLQLGIQNAVPPPFSSVVDAAAAVGRTTAVGTAATVKRLRLPRSFRRLMGRASVVVVRGHHRVGRHFAYFIRR